MQFVLLFYDLFVADYSEPLFGIKIVSNLGIPQIVPRSLKAKYSQMVGNGLS